LVHQSTYLIVILVLVIFVALVVLVFIVFVLKIIFVEIIQAVLELQRLAGKPVDGAWDQLLLDVLTQLIVEFELGFDFLVNLLLLIIWWGGGVEEVEE
jgi:hypothetical protein